MSRLHETVRCPDCGTDFAAEPGIPGLCPRCLIGFGLRDSLPQTPVQDGSPDGEQLVTLTRLAPGQVLGERYQVREFLGRGGMGEVFRAFDLKLRVDVALKAVRDKGTGSAQAHDLLRREVRTAREVVSPNVCRIFDLAVEEGQEFVSMEFVDGVTLAETLERRGPLALQEAREIAAQFLTGLEAIHRTGLVHRDFKPENVMITTASRVVVMDFGLAKLASADATGTISGTPAYMAPEQMRGEPVEARADVYAAGVVLAEMVSIGGRNSLVARQALWRSLRRDPPQVPDGPWAGIIRQALATRAEDRYGSARALARALEEVAQQLPGLEARRPYPGLACFGEQDAEYFFGREVEVEALLRKLRRPRMLALVAPSGAGKSSFLRAGLLPALPSGWKTLVTTPGNRPFQSLARAVAPAFAGDAGAIESLLRFDEEDAALGLLHRLRQRHDQVVAIFDQFEELFTLNPPEIQRGFARLLGRLVLDADTHVILSVRDDFLLRCQEYEDLMPAFADLTPLGTLGDDALRRVLVQPALACGYRFEDASLVEEMLGEVRRERGALPLLAFAASRLWEERDRERGLITREAYRQIGGVAGALVQHAEATLERIGSQRLPIVRELFRNLVTAEGTRAVCDRGELLSVFEAPAPEPPSGAATESGPARAGVRDRATAAGVLGALVDARLVTSYERADDCGDSRQHLEVVHESLLRAWPRLVRWRTQDADGAQLRDQLRQAAQLWNDRGRPADLLWSGTAYRDFSLWRERSPVPLTATEDAFAHAMQKSASRRRRRRRAAVAAMLAVAATVASVTSVLWRRADAARRTALTESRRAEASKLLALGQLELERDPTASLAYALRSLELADTDVGRLFALRALQLGPLATLTALRPPGDVKVRSRAPSFSPDGQWLALGGFGKVQVLNRDGRPPLLFGDYPLGGSQSLEAGFAGDAHYLVGNRRGDIRVWSFPDGREVKRAAFEQGPSGLAVGGDGFWTETWAAGRLTFRKWSYGEAEPRLVGSVAATGPSDLDAEGGRLVICAGRKIYLRSLSDWKPAAAQLVVENSDDVIDVRLSRDGGLLAASDQSGVSVWNTRGGSARLVRRFAGPPAYGLRFDASGSRLAGIEPDESGPAVARVWDLDAPAVAEPLRLRKGGQFASAIELEFDPSGQWLVSAHGGDAAFWPLGRPHSVSFAGHRGPVASLAFTPDGRWLVSASNDGSVRAWPMSAATASEARVLVRRPLIQNLGIAVDGEAGLAAVADGLGHVVVAPLSGGPALELSGLPAQVGGVVAFQSRGRLLAAAPYAGPLEERLVHVFDLQTGSDRVLPPVPGALDGTPLGFDAIRFVDDGRILVSVVRKGLLLYDLESGTGRALPGPSGPFALSRDGQVGVGISVNIEAVPGRPNELVRFALDGARPVTLRSHGGPLTAVAVDDGGSLVASGSLDGVVRVGATSGAEPHVLIGHQGWVRALAFSPDGRWLASGGDDKTIRLWPVPDVASVPLQRRSHKELLALLRSQTNLRVVPAPGSPTGWQLDREAFPGWSHSPAP